MQDPELERIHTSSSRRYEGLKKLVTELKADARKVEGILNKYHDASDHPKYVKVKETLKKLNDDLKELEEQRDDAKGVRDRAKRAIDKLK